MADAAAGSERTPHKYNYTSALEVPLAGFLDGNPVLQGHVLTDLQFRIREVDTLKAELLKRAAAPAPAVSAGPVAGDALRIKELTKKLEQSVADTKVQTDALTAAVEGYKVEKSAWDAEKLVLEGRLASMISGSAVMVAGGAPSATEDLNRLIREQKLEIDSLNDLVIHWRELCDSRTSSTNSNTLDGLLLKLQRVLRLPFDDPDSVYVAVAEAIYAHTTVKQRLQISDAPVDKAGFIDYLVNFFKTDSSATSESDSSESDEDLTDAPNTDGIQLVERPKSAQTPPRPDSARAQKHNEKTGMARRAAASASSKIRSVVNRVRGISGGAKSDLSTLLSDLKHVSENDAYAPPI